jgi:hypothetical protein
MGRLREKGVNNEKFKINRFGVPFICSRGFFARAELLDFITGRAGGSNPL